MKEGAPVMMSFDPIDGSGAVIALTGDAAVMAVPTATRFVAIFDRILDPDSLENDAGVAKAGIATAQSPAAALGVPMTTTYSPGSDYKLHLLILAGPSLTVSAPCGLPSGAGVQVSLDLTKLRSHDLSKTAEAAPGVSPLLSVMTEALSVTTDIPEPTVGDPVMGTVGGPAVIEDATTTFNLTFSAMTPGPSAPPACAGPASNAAHIKVTATIGAVPVAIEAVVSQDAADPTHWTVSPPGTTADAPGSWPADTVVTVTIDAGATDTFGVPLGSDTIASFTVKS